MIPPFVTMSFDDCSRRHDFRYADIAVKHGYVPMPSLFIHNVSGKLLGKIREGFRIGKVEYNTHAFDYYNHLYHEYGRGDHNTEKLKEIFSYDEYIGLDKEAPQGFGNFIKTRLFSKINCKSVNYMDGDTLDIDAECERYSRLLKEFERRFSDYISAEYCLTATMDICTRSHYLQKRRIMAKVALLM